MPFWHDENVTVYHVPPLVAAARGRLEEETRRDRDREIHGGGQIGRDRQRAKETEPRRGSHLLRKEMNMKRENTRSLANEAEATRGQRAKSGEKPSAFSRPLTTKIHFRESQKTTKCTFQLHANLPNLLFARVLRGKSQSVFLFFSDWSPFLKKQKSLSLKKGNALRIHYKKVFSCSSTV